MVPATVRKLWSGPGGTSPDRAVCPPELLPIAGAIAARACKSPAGWLNGVFGDTRIERGARWDFANENRDYHTVFLRCCFAGTGHGHALSAPALDKLRPSICSGNRFGVSAVSSFAGVCRRRLSLAQAISVDSLALPGLHRASVGFVLIPGNPFAPRINGAHRWIRVGHFTVQSSELAKIALIIALAHYGRTPVSDPCRRFFGGCFCRE